MKKWCQSKTMWFNIIGLVVSGAQDLFNAFPAGGKLAGIALYVIAIGNIILRFNSFQGIEKIGNANRS